MARKKQEPFVGSVRSEKAVVAQVAHIYESDQQQPSLPATASGPRLRDFFLLGCGVGNHIAMLPVPSTSPDDRSLDEFLTTAARLKLDQDGVLVGLRQVKEELALQAASQQPNSEVKAVIERYFNLMERIV